MSVGLGMEWINVRREVDLMADYHEAYLGCGDGITGRDGGGGAGVPPTYVPSHLSLIPMIPWTGDLNHVLHRRHYPVPTRS